MDAYRATKVQELSELVECGAYSVDPKAVADAILLRLSGADLVREYAWPSRRARPRPSAVLTGATRKTRASRREKVLAA